MSIDSTQTTPSVRDQHLNELDVSRDSEIKRLQDFSTTTVSTFASNRDVQNAKSNLLKYLKDTQQVTIDQKVVLLKGLIEAYNYMSKILSKKNEAMQSRTLTEEEKQDKTQLEEYIRIFDKYIKQLNEDSAVKALVDEQEKQKSEVSGQMQTQVTNPALPSIPIMELPTDIGSYTLEKEKTGGRNNKGKPGVYKYQREGFQEEEIFLKLDEPAKTLAEFIAGRAVRHACGDIAPEMKLVQEQNGVYLGSRLINGFTDLYRLVDPTLKDRYPGLEVVHQEKVGKVLNDFPGDVARFSAICWLIGDFDRHSGNIGVVGRDVTKGKIGSLKVIDFGGAFKGLEDEVHPHSISRHLPWKGPINFFYLFPRELRISREMADELHRVADDKTIVESILNAIDESANFDGFTAKDLCEFGERLGMTDIETLKEGSDKKACAEAIKTYVKTKMENRQKSLKQFALEIEIDLCIKKTDDGRFFVNHAALKNLVKANPEYFNERLKDKSFHFRDDAHRGSFFERITVNFTKNQLSMLMVDAIHEVQDELDQETSKATRSADLSLLDTKQTKLLQDRVNREKQNAVEPLSSNQNEFFTTIIQDDTRNTEISFFNQTSYYGPRNTDVVHRLEFYFDTAEKAAREKYQNNPDLLEKKLNFLKEKRDYFIGRASEIKIDPNEMRSENPEEYFKPISAQIKSLYSEALNEILMGVYVKEDEIFNAKASYREFKKTSQLLLIERGRSNVVHVYHDGVISAQLPVGKTSYTSEYRSSETPGVIPNQSTDIYVFENGVVSRAHRGASLSVIGLTGDDKKSTRIRLNYENGKSQITEIAKMVVASQNDLNPGDTINLSLDAHSLLTPLFEKKMESLAVRLLKTFGVDYKGETRQLKDLYLALGALNGQILEIDSPNGQGKVNVKLDITLTNLPVGVDRDDKPSRLLRCLGRDQNDLMSNLQSTINTSGIGKIIQKQQQQLQEWSKSSQSSSASQISNFLNSISVDQSLYQDIKHLERERSLLYKEMMDLLAKDDPKYLKIRDQVLVKDKEIAGLYKKIDFQMQEKLKNIDLDGLRKSVTTELEAGVFNEPKDRDRLQQTLYLLDVMENYFNGKYLEPDNSYLFSAMLSELGRLSGSEQMVNCKSAKDRTQRKREMDALLVKAANDPERKNVPLRFNGDNGSSMSYIKTHLPALARYSSGLRLIDQNSPGARGNRKPLPFGLGDAAGVLASKWHKVKPSKPEVKFEHSIPNVKVFATKILEAYENIKNPVLRQSFVRKALEKVYDGCVSTLLSKEQVSQLNQSFSDGLSSAVRYIEFLKITEMPDCRDVFTKAMKLHHLMMAKVGELKLPEFDFQGLIKDLKENYVDSFFTSQELDPARIKKAGSIITSLIDQLTAAKLEVERLKEKYDMGETYPDKLKAIIGDEKFEEYQNMVSSLDQKLKSLNTQLGVISGYLSQLAEKLNPLLMNSEKSEVKTQLPNQKELIDEFAKTLADQEASEVKVSRDSMPVASPAA